MVMKNVVKKNQKIPYLFFTHAVLLPDGIGTKWDNGKGNCF